jgi:hypothetical protein
MLSTARKTNLIASGSILTLGTVFGLAAPAYGAILGAVMIVVILQAVESMIETSSTVARCAFFGSIFLALGAVVWMGAGAQEWAIGGAVIFAMWLVIGAAIEDP